MFIFDERQRLWPAPNFQLPCLSGGNCTRASYRDRANLLLMFLDRKDCEPCWLLVQALLLQEQLLDEHETKLLVFVPTDLANLLQGEAYSAYTIPLLADDRGKVRGQYAALVPELDESEPFLMLLDRYGAPYCAYGSSELASDRTVDSVLHQIMTLQLECPE